MINVPEWARKMTKLELANLVTDCNGACSKKYFAIHGAVTHITQALNELERSKGNPNDDSQLVWNNRFDGIWRDLVCALDGLKEAT